jgi:hypothetical protein
MDQETPDKAKDVQGAKVLRTFEDDIADAMRDGKGSALGIVLAEQKKRDQVVEVVQEKKTSSLFLIMGVVLLLLSLGGALYFAYDRFGVNVLPDTQKGTAEYVHPLIQADSIKTIPIDTLLPKNGADASLLYKLGGAELSKKSVTVVVPTNSTDEVTVESDISTVLPRIGAYMPGGLKRSVTTPYAFGVYSGDSAETFLVLTVDNFENAFAGMLEWEKFMSDDLFRLFAVTLPNQSAAQSSETNTVSQINPGAVASSTASSTPVQPVQNTVAIRDIGQFVDRTIKNKDMRVIQDESGKIYFVYGFVSRKYIVITTSPESYFEVVRRIR